jgi:protein TorT
VDEARSIGVGIRLVEAGGYDNLPTQQAQLTELAQAGVDGIILGSISYTGNNDIVAALAEDGVPVIEVINDIEAGAIAAKALVSFYDMGFFAGEHVAAQAEAEDKDAVSVLFLPGPKGSGWADDTLVGFQAATEFAMADITLLDVKWGDTGAKAQSELLVEALAAHPEVDYIVGNAVAADVAVDILQQAERSAKIVSTYITPPVYDHIREGDIEAAPADMTVDQARIAVGMMVRLLNGEEPGKDFPFRAGPLIPVVTRTSIGEISYERLFGPRDFTPVFEMKP